MNSPRMLYSNAELAQKRRLVFEVDRRLYQYFGDPQFQRREPLHELILTILSQNTSDHNRDMAFRRFKAEFPTWEDAASASADKIEASIRSGGLAKQKSLRIKEILNWVNEQSGEYSLDWLKDFPWETAMVKLISINGVGIKTAAVVMCFGFNAPVFPVDVHIHRICRRLNLAPNNGTPEKTHWYMQPLIPQGRWKELHLNMLKLGRQFCRPASPLCIQCPISNICPSSSA